MQLYYATRDGQSRAHRRANCRIALPRRHPRSPRIWQQPARAQELAAARLVTVVAAVVMAGISRKETASGLYRTLRDPPPLVLLSVNLTARKPGKDTAEGNAYLRQVDRPPPASFRPRPGHCRRLDYARYGWLDRQLIRFIMKLTGGPTDLTTSIEYTAWNVVDDVALRIAELYGRTEPSPS